MKYLESFDLFGSGEYERMTRSRFMAEINKMGNVDLSEEQRIKLSKLFQGFFGPKSVGINSPSVKLIHDGYFFYQSVGGVHFFIQPYDDEWYLIEAVSGTGHYYKCDGLEGIEKMLSDSFDEVLESFDLFGGGDYKQIHRGLFQDKWAKSPGGKLTEKEALKLDRLFMKYFGPGLKTELYGDQDTNMDMMNVRTPFYFYGEVRGKDKTFPKPDEPKPDKQDFFIFVYEDDWYVVEIYEDIDDDLTSRYFECDGFGGIEKLFEDLSKINEASIADLIKDLPKELTPPPAGPDVKLVSQHTCKQRWNGKKLLFKIKWYNTAEHDLTKRISERSSFQSVRHFNEIFKGFLDMIFPSMIGKEILVSGRYSFYFEEYNVSIIIVIDVDNIMKNNNNEILVITILSGDVGINVVKTIVIPEL
jgi:hypothetical protein